MFDEKYRTLKSLLHEFDTAIKIYRGRMKPVDMRGFMNARLVPKGDGHCVFLMQGFLENDYFVEPVADSLEVLGYRPRYFQGGWNYIQRSKTLKKSFTDWNFFHAERRLINIWEENDNEPVSIVAHSAGGALAHHLAIKHHEKIRNIITLAAPTRISLVKGQCRAPLSDVFLLWCRNHSVVRSPRILHGILSNIGKVPATSIIDAADAGVHPLTCVLPKTKLTQNFFVDSAGKEYSGHYGIWANPDAHKIMALVLGQKLGQYKKITMGQLEKAEINIDRTATFNPEICKLPDEVQLLKNTIREQQTGLVDLSR